MIKDGHPVWRGYNFCESLGPPRTIFWICYFHLISFNYCLIFQKSPSLQLNSTYQIELEDWGGFTVVPSSGQIVVYGRGEGDTEDRLYIYTPEGAKVRTIKAPAPNMVEPQLLVMAVNGQETLVASYKTSKKIYLEDLIKQLIKVAFPNRVYNLPLLCKGEGDTMYVYSEGIQSGRSQKYRELSEYNCSTVPITKTRALTSELDECCTMCYLPPPYKSVVVANTHTIRSVSAESGEVIWEGGKEFDGLMIRSRRLLFHSSLGLLVCDVENKRILMLASSSGEILNSFLLNSVGDILDLCMYEEKIVILHNDNGRKMSFFSLK